MEIKKEKNGENLKVTLIGRLDTTTAPTLEQSLKDDLKDCKDLTFDFNDVDYISSAGLRVLLSSQKTMTANGGKMKVINVSKEVDDVFEITSFKKVLTIERK